VVWGIEKGKIKLNQYGVIAYQYWKNIPKHFPNINLDEFVIMPNHVHGIVIINNVRPVPVGTGLKPVPTTKSPHSLSEIIRGFKTFSSRRINETKPPINYHWQRSFYDHIIRNESSCAKIREYITNNPLRWDFDQNANDILKF